MIFNFTNNYQCATRLYLNEKQLKRVKETKLLGCIISEDLTWHSNTAMTIKKGYNRMLILHNLFKFNIPISELINIYMMYIRSVLEQSCVIWHSSITSGERYDLERVQKVALTS